MTAKYDTLDSLELPPGTTLYDVYTWVLGLPMALVGQRRISWSAIRVDFDFRQSVTDKDQFHSALATASI